MRVSGLPQIEFAPLPQRPIEPRSREATTGSPNGEPTDFLLGLEEIHVPKDGCDRSFFNYRYYFIIL